MNPNERIEESILNAFDDHIDLLKTLQSISNTDINNSIFSDKYFWKFYDIEFTYYNETIFVSRLLDEYVFRPDITKTQKEFFVNKLNRKLKNHQKSKFIDTPEFIDNKSHREYAEKHEMDLPYAVMDILWDKDIETGSESKKFVTDLLKTEYYERVIFIKKNIKKLPGKYQIKACKAYKKQIKRKFSYKLYFPIIDTNHLLMTTPSEDFERMINRGQLYKDLENDILEILVRIMERKNTKRVEDLINDDVTDHLRSKGYQVTDQTRSGKSESGRSAGSIDIMIRDNRNLPLTIIESMRLTSIGEKNTSVASHINKVLKNYDTSKLSDKYILVFAEAKDFDSLCRKYSSYLSRNNPSSGSAVFFESVSRLRKPFGKSIDSIRAIETFSRIGGSYMKLNHILIDMCT